jgi:hypothetical protein
MGRSEPCRMDPVGWRQRVQWCRAASRDAPSGLEEETLRVWAVAACEVDAPAAWEVVGRQGQEVRRRWVMEMRWSSGSGGGVASSVVFILPMNLS